MLKFRVREREDQPRGGQSVLRAQETEQRRQDTRDVSGGNSPSLPCTRTLL